MSVTAVRSRRAQEPAGVSKRCRLLDIHSQVGMREKLLAQVINHLHIRKIPHWNREYRTRRLWSLQRKILLSAGEAGAKLQDPGGSWKACVLLNLDGFCTRVSLGGNTELLSPPAALQLLQPGMA